jgi:predicted Zn-dependent protease
MLDVGIGDAVAAEDRLRAIIADFPGAEAPVGQLFVLLRNQGRGAEAAELIEAQLAVAPSSRYLRLVHGGLLSEQGRIDEAVAVYEVLYAEDTSDLVVANNYASLLGTHFGDDPEVLDRAATIARRLRGREVPAFQDTYGWIEFQRGNLRRRSHISSPPPPRNPNEAIVQYHLGRAYEAAERLAEARVQYERALELAGALRSPACRSSPSPASASPLCRRPNPIDRPSDPQHQRRARPSALGRPFHPANHGSSPWAAIGLLAAVHCVSALPACRLSDDREHVNRPLINAVGTASSVCSGTT